MSEMFFFPLDMLLIIVMHLVLLIESGSCESVQTLKQSSKSRQNFSTIISQSSDVRGMFILSAISLNSFFLSRSRRFSVSLTKRGSYPPINLILSMNVKCSHPLKKTSVISICEKDIHGWEPIKN